MTDKQSIGGNSFFYLIHIVNFTGNSTVNLFSMDNYVIDYLISAMKISIYMGLQTFLKTVSLSCLL